MPVIELRSVAKAYGPVPVVEDLDLTVADGDFLCLLGPSGCGKTTTLRLIAGLEAPSAGRIAIGGEVLADGDRGLFVPAERRGLGFVFQSYALWPHLTVAENVAFGLRLRGLDRHARAARVAEVLRTLAIDRLAARYPSQLSGGQQQRVALARTLAVAPSVLLLDEPLSNLDARLRLEMREELKRLHAAFATTVVFVTHDQWEAMTLAGTIAVMDGGRLLQLGTPEDIYARPASRFVAEFVGAPPINILDLECRCPLLDGLRPRLAPGSAVIGLRPEALGLAPRERPGGGDVLAADARVAAVMPTGGTWLVELVCGEARLTAHLMARPAAEVGTTVRIAVPAADLHVFAADGARLEGPAANARASFPPAHLTKGA
ncbi:MAG: ABC transporter ATP-binding protein [Pseudomonadota bacterium]